MTPSPPAPLSTNDQLSPIRPSRPCDQCLRSSHHKETINSQKVTNIWNQGALDAVLIHPVAVHILATMTLR
ncbi:hypothetical protein SAMN06309944_2213 [Micrococcales bacterium KH10]|nr:hypothetical protein SAMN06309944_2213 [Micrococcales bacterium KH10]